ncbi:MAG: SdpI family protein [Bacteroidota bacterium]
MKLSEWLFRNWLAFAILLIPIALLLYLWPEIPDHVPAHWNAAGEIDDFGSKYSLFLMPGLGMLAILIVLIFVYWDPRNSMEKYQHVLQNMMVIIALFMSIMSMSISLYAANYEIDVMQIIFYAVLGLNLFLGNLFGKLKPNYFVGIRTPWTMESDSVWHKTHRFSGKVWVAASLIMMLILPVFPINIFIVLFFGYLSVLVILPVIFSWQQFQQEKASA